MSINWLRLSPWLGSLATAVGVTYATSQHGVGISARYCCVSIRCPKLAQRGRACYLHGCALSGVSSALPHTHRAGVAGIWWTLHGGTATNSHTVLCADFGVIFARSVTLLVLFSDARVCDVANTFRCAPVGCHRFGPQRSTIYCLDITMVPHGGTLSVHANHAVLNLDAIVGTTMFADPLCRCGFGSVRGLIIILRGNLSLSSQKRNHLVIYLAVALVPALLWWWHNIAVSGTPMGERAPSVRSLADNIGLLCATLGRWFFPYVPSAPTIYLLGVIVLIPVLATLWLWRRRSAEFTPLLAVLTAYLVAYLSLLVITASRVAHDQLHHRLLSPAYPPLVIMLLKSYEIAVMPRLPNLRAQLAVLGVMVLLFLPKPVVYTLHRIRETYQTGTGCESQVWRNSPTLRFVRETTLNDPIYSNAPDAIYLYTGRKCRLAPRKTFYQSYVPATRDLAQFGDVVAHSRSVYMVWFFNTNVLTYIHLSNFRRFSVCI